MSTVTLDIASNLDLAAKAVGDLAARQIPFAVASALTRTAASLARDELPNQMRTRLSQGGPPTPFTTRAFQYQRAEKNSLVAVVYSAPKQGIYLRQLAEGRRRGRKPFELKLDAVTDLDATQLVPTRKARRTAAGNVSRAVIDQAIKDKTKYFAGTPRGGGRGQGVYQRLGKGKNRKLRAIFVAAQVKAYARLLPLTEIAEQHVAKVFQGELNKAVAMAMATAR